MMSLNNPWSHLGPRPTIISLFVVLNNDGVVTPDSKTVRTLINSLLGKNNCIWSSCREGCTKEVYTCWQVGGNTNYGGCQQ